MPTAPASRLGSSRSKLPEPAPVAVVGLSSESVLKTMLELESERTTLKIANEALQAEMEK